MSAFVRVAAPLRRSAQSSTRCIHQTPSRHAITNLQMPAMSPTMTEGGIASWKKKEGDAFVAGDVLLEIETDKATIDVEAQDDGILSKIIAQDGAKNVAVGKIIALLAEEGDDISNIEAPKDEPAPQKEERPSATPPTQSQSSPEPQKSQNESSSSKTSGHANLEHSRPLFPSVHRLLLEHRDVIKNASDIKGTGMRGMLTKGDVLAFLGKASGPLGSYTGKELKTEMETKINQGGVKAEEVKPLDGHALRQLIVSNFLKTSLKARNTPGSMAPPTFDSIIADYLPSPASIPKSTVSPTSIPVAKKSTLDVYFEGLL